MRSLLLSAAALIAVLALAACRGTGVATRGDSEPGGDSDAPSHDEPQVGSVTWSLHDSYESLVLVSWDQLEPATVQVQFRVGEEDWQTTPEVEAEAGSQAALLLGIPYAHEFSFRVLNDFGAGALEGELHQGQTGDLPQGAPAATLIVADSDSWEPTMVYVLACTTGDRGWTLILDRQARLVWARQTDRSFTTMYARPSYDGRHLLIDHNSYWQIFDGGATSEVLRLKIDGSDEQTWATPGLHHAFLELDDGSILWGAADERTETLERLDTAGEQSTLWSCRDFYDTHGYSGTCQSNTLTWREAGDSLLYSFWSNDSVLELDRTSGSVQRIFGQLDGAWSFSEASAAFWWQHGARYTDEGTLITSTYAADGDPELVVREYELDEGQLLLHEIWNFGVGDGVIAHEMGDVHRLPGGNTLHNCGSAMRLREGTPDGAVVWDISWDDHGQLGLTTPLDDLYALAP